MWNNLLLNDYNRAKNMAAHLRIHADDTTRDRAWRYWKAQEAAKYEAAAKRLLKEAQGGVRWWEK